MKQILLPACLFLFFVTSGQVKDSAQSNMNEVNQLTKDDVNLIQAAFGKDKRDIMEQYMKFPDQTTASSFWKLYDSYEGERKKLGQEFVSILQDYSKNYGNLNDKKADELITRTSANNIAFENLYSNYYKKMKPVVGALKASQFFQLESYLRSVIKTSILDDIPFIGEIDRTKKPVGN